jgi:CTP:phosphocholine cytidylyltransferase-like protein
MRAILLAAGMGTRLRPLTLTTPKSLIKVKGKPMIEKQIEYLKEISVDEIIIVVGYLKEKFEYLKEKYGVTLIHNDKYNQYNNIYSMYLVKEFLPGSYVIDADVFLNRNFLVRSPKFSMYFSARKKAFKNEWIIHSDNSKIQDIVIGDGDNDYILCGISYWSIEDGNYIEGKLKEAISTKKYKNLYWDDIVKENIHDLSVYLHEINPDDSYEIDSLEDLEKVNMLLEIR